MREIKFRGMSLSGKWFYGDLAKPKNDISSSVKGGGYFISNEYGMPHAYAVRPETVGQYTGLKDRNGVEIYELCEVDERYIVVYIAPRFVLYEILTNDIIDIYEQATITQEYRELSKDQEGFINEYISQAEGEK